MTHILLAQAQAVTPFFGQIDPPAALAAYGSNGGLVMFANNSYKLAVVIGGIMALGNVVMAGFIYLSASGDAKAHEKVLSKLNLSLWGLVVMVMAPAMVAIAGWLLFKNSMYFLSPQIQGPSANTRNSTRGVPNNSQPLGGP